MACAQHHIDRRESNVLSIGSFTRFLGGASHELLGSRRRPSHERSRSDRRARGGSASCRLSRPDTRIRCHIRVQLRDSRTYQALLIRPQPSQGSVQPDQTVRHARALRIACGRKEVGRPTTLMIASGTLGRPVAPSCLPADSRWKSCERRIGSAERRRALVRSSTLRRSPFGNNLATILAVSPQCHYNIELA